MRIPIVPEMNKEVPSKERIKGVMVPDPITELLKGYR